MKSLIFIISLTTIFLFSGCATKEKVVTQEQKIQEPFKDIPKENLKNMLVVIKEELKNIELEINFTKTIF